jgi:hypothetical protein
MVREKHICKMKPLPRFQQGEDLHFAGTAELPNNAYETLPDSSSGDQDNKDPASPAQGGQLPPCALPA